MLARANRIVSADDYKRLVRKGRRLSEQHVVVYVACSDSGAQPRFGFIVPKTVGVAVDRNLVRRRLKALGHEALPSIAPGTDVVVRALPGAAQVGWDTLRAEISEAFDRGVRQA
jgi:ribonuclease P protein component